ncbi:MAG: potassium transporter TrkG [Bacteroidia bacterium]|nr:potassium transporter TrkG [Bacteroidia bacterium]
MDKRWWKNQIQYTIDDIRHTWSILYEQYLQNAVNGLLLHFHLFIHHWGGLSDRLINIISIIAALICYGNIFWLIGFETTPEITDTCVSINHWIIFTFGIIQLYKLLGYWRDINKTPISEILYAISTWTYLYLTNDSNLIEGEIVPNWQLWLSHKWVTCVVALIISSYEISRQSLAILTRRFNPMLIFAGSFALIIFIGTGLFLMPKAHIGDLSFADALFTATSATCITGLSVIDISTQLSFFGQIILLVLVQVGGLGVMSFTSFFALSVTGKASMQNRIIIKDLVSANNISDIFTTLLRIMYVTLTLEAISAWCLYIQIGNNIPELAENDRLFYAIFHAVIAFCNAGFSCIPAELNDAFLITNHGVQWILGLTVVFGSAGFPLQSSAIDWTKHKIKVLFVKLFRKKNKEIFRPRLIDTSCRLMFWSHIILLIGGILLFMLTESNQTQSDCSLWDRISQSFFLSINSRSCGMAVVDLNLTTPATIALLITFMWIGGAPLSTGGGIKLTTFSLAILNLRNVILGRDNIQIFGRRVSRLSVQKAMATIALSVIGIIFSYILLVTFEPELEPNRIFFEVVSALTTTGLSLGVTPYLCTASKIVLILNMFIGRIGLLAFMMCFITPKAYPNVKYPTETITI